MRAFKEITTEDADGFEVTLRLPCIMEVCGSCRGTGTHVNRNIDGNGITSSEWAEWDDEDRETYMSGGYDVVCEECGGANVVAVVDEEHLTDEQRDAWYEHCAGEREENYERAYFARMEGGY